MNPIYTAVVKLSKPVDVLGGHWMTINLEHEERLLFADYDQRELFLAIMRDRGFDARAGEALEGSATAAIDQVAKALDNMGKSIAHRKRINLENNQ